MTALTLTPRARKRLVDRSLDVLTWVVLAVMLAPVFWLVISAFQDDRELAELIGEAGATLIGFRALRELLSSGPLIDDELHAEALALLRESAAMKRARETVRMYAEQARAELEPLPDGEAKRAMDALCDFIADRTS